jgi:hypothetical protein
VVRSVLRSNPSHRNDDLDNFLKPEETYNTLSEVSPSSLKDCISSPCAPSKMAEVAVLNWQQKVQTSLRQGVALVERDSDSLFTVKIFWVDDVTKTVADATTQEKNSTLGDINEDGDSTDDVDFNGSGTTNSNEINYKSITLSFEP